MLASTLNPTNMFIQFRDSLENKMICDTLNATIVLVDDYIWDDKTFYRVQKAIAISEFNSQVGILFENTKELIQLRDDYSDKSMSLTVISFADSAGSILWEISCLDIAYLGCISKATLHLFPSDICLDQYLSDHQQCVRQYLSPMNKNTLGVFYKDDSIHQLGFYKFNYEINYSVLTHQFCFKCDYFVNGDYELSSCEENQQLIKKKLKTEEIQFGIISKFESVVFSTIVSECVLSIFAVFAAISVVLTAIVVVFVVVLMQKV
ncbi:Hypothetical_protein [Hexamita inflata]|uniref:Hypothetical_protein n=1 Tax=Hexamita inflata TaxID=28002 RepID=A0AA86QRE7_9EUKA|nr:Hypothetical protein HINF_LOCUS46882 [Hexamita inflata]